MTSKYGQGLNEKPKARPKIRPWSIRSWITGENRYDWAQVFGPSGAPYFRFDASHHLHRQISRLKLARNLRTHLLAAWLILAGVLEVIPFVIPGARILLALLAIATGILVLLDHQRETRDEEKA